MSAAPASRASRNTVAWLVATALAVAFLVAAGARVNRERIARNEAARVTQVLAEMLPPGSYDNRPDEDRVMVNAPDPLGSATPLPVYRARKDGRPAAAVVTAVARQGYVGPIRLLVALDTAGTVIAVRVVEHRETPGLGGRIDADPPDWLAQFAGRTAPTIAGDGHWAVRRDGGDFDQLTGATVTSRAVVNAVRGAAQYFVEHREELFARPPD